MLFSLQYLKAKAVMQLIQGVFLLFQLSLMLLWGQPRWFGPVLQVSLLAAVVASFISFPAAG